MSAFAYGLYRNWVGARPRREGEAYCEALVPMIEAYRRENGAYPASLESFALDVEAMPEILRRQEWYWSDGETFSFSFWLLCKSFWNPLMPAVTYYASDQRYWRGSSG